MSDYTVSWRDRFELLLNNSQVCRHHWVPSFLTVYGGRRTPVTCLYCGQLMRTKGSVGQPVTVPVAAGA